MNVIWLGQEFSMVDFYSDNSKIVSNLCSKALNNHYFYEFFKFLSDCYSVFYFS